MILISEHLVVNLNRIQFLEVDDGELLADGSSVYHGEPEQTTKLFKAITDKWKTGFTFFDISDWKP